MKKENKKPAIDGDGMVSFDEIAPMRKARNILAVCAFALLIAVICLSVALVQDAQEGPEVQPEAGNSQQETPDTAKPEAGEGNTAHVFELKAYNPETSDLITPDGVEDRANGVRAYLNISGSRFASASWSGKELDLGFDCSSFDSHKCKDGLKLERKLVLNKPILDVMEFGNAAAYGYELAVLFEDGTVALASLEQLFIDGVKEFRELEGVNNVVLLNSGTVTNSYDLLGGGLAIRADGNAYILSSYLNDDEHFNIDVFDYTERK